MAAMTVKTVDEGSSSVRGFPGGTRLKENLIP